MFDQFIAILLVTLGFIVGAVALLEPLYGAVARIGAYLRLLWSGPVGPIEPQENMRRQ